jgi:hypothetical protein
VEVQQFGRKSGVLTTNEGIKLNWWEGSYRESICHD